MDTFTFQVVLSDEDTRRGILPPLALFRLAREVVTRKLDEVAKEPTIWRTATLFGGIGLMGIRGDERVRRGLNYRKARKNGAIW